MAGFLQVLLYIFMVLLSLFLILIILLQRGKGGGLVGAFGGMGGNSAFGARTSDVFMKITVVAAIIWFVVCVGGRYILKMDSGVMSGVSEKVVATAPEAPAAATPEASAAATPEAAAPTSENASSGDAE